MLSCSRDLYLLFELQRSDHKRSLNSKIKQMCVTISKTVEDS